MGIDWIWHKGWLSFRWLYSGVLICEDGSNRLDIDEWMDIIELEYDNDSLSIEVLGTGRMDISNLLEFLNFCGVEKISGELDWGEKEALLMN